MDGWMTVKKRGRDDDQIAADRKKAEDLRRQRKGLPPKKAPAAKKKKKPAARRAKTQDRMDSLVGFVVDDDEEEEVEWNSNEDESEEESEMELDEEEEEDEEEEPPPRKKKAYSKNNCNSDSDSDVISSEEEDTFFRPYQPKSHKINGAAPKAKNGGGKKKGGRLQKASNKQQRQQTIDLTPSSSDEEDRKPAATKAKTLSRSSLLQQQQQPHDSNDEDDSDAMADDSVLYEPDGVVASKYFAKSSASSSLIDSLVDLVDTPHQAGAIRKKPSASSLAATGGDDLEDTPMEADAIRKKPKKKKKRRLESQYNSKLVLGADDYCDDPDEAIALIAAQEESERQTLLADKNDASAGNSSEDEDEPDEDNRDDSYVDPEARAASSILETADELSAQIVQTLAGWSSTAVDGMIVDGALSLSTVATASSPNSWIVSAATLREILPNITLADYQLIGVNWLALLHGMQCEVKGGGGSGAEKKYTPVNGILADEMGLGKTCQTIAFLSWLKHCRNPGSKKKSAAGGSKESAVNLDDSDDDDSVAVTGTRRKDEGDDNNDNESTTHPHLVVAPASVLSNWKLEFEKFAPDLVVVKYHGSMSERTDIQHHLRQFQPGKKKRAGAEIDVVLAPITYFQKEKSDDRNFLRRFSWDYLVVDEGHVLKNARGQRFKSLDSFSTLHRLLLTGTPVQNSPKELLSLLSFLMPLFSNKDSDSFDEQSGNDGGESMLQHFVSLESGGSNGKSDYQMAYRKLKKLFSPFVLRRKKVDVLSQILPPKTRKVELVELDAVARQRYNSVLEDHIEAKKKGTKAVNEHLFTQLRKAAHHPLMLRTRHTTPEQKAHLTQWFYQYGAFRGDGCTKGKVAEELEKFNDFEIHLTAVDLVEENRFRGEQLDRYILREDDLFCSAKFVRLRKLLPELIEKGHRVLIFSVWTTCLDLLSCLVEHLGHAYLRMDGSTAVSERQSLIDKFNRDSSIPVFLLSTNACGLGINLCAADVCLMHDLSFNPFNDLQAEDRCHRIGQSKEVTVIRLVSKDTVDEDIYEMQQRKALMNSAIMDNESDFNKNASDEKNVIEQAAIERFLRSPAAAGGERYSTTATTASMATTSDKENAMNADAEEEDI